MIPVNEPLLGANTEKYVLDCLNTGWISSAGSYIRRFEESFAAFVGVKHAVTTTSGTTALHLALAALGIGPGDEVLVPDLTMIAVPYAVLYTGARPVLLDVDPETFNLDPDRLREFIRNWCRFDPGSKKLLHKRTGGAVRAVLPVHLYGHPCRMDEIMDLARENGLFVVEDAAEAHGAQYISERLPRPLPAGSMGDAGCFSFYANKIITTGEGGMVVTDSDAVAERCRRLKDLAHSPGRRFLHTDLAYNYRMTNVQAAIGLAQVEEVERFLSLKRKMAEAYHRGLSGLDGLTLPLEKPWGRSVYWMYAVLVEQSFGLSREEMASRLKERGVDTRTFFVPVHEQPVFQKDFLPGGESFPVSIALSRKGFYLPSGLALTPEQIDEVCRAVTDVRDGR
ncbi:MAG: DegT/DnrJ/EryC1/StrS aminotransferase family protein [Candidatus Aminicenantes bacterium]|nr:DegT/DnrJ/EryC1/StrS aminotransferase family protein [Candidatus Aminicenantes bacterium]